MRVRVVNSSREIEVAGGQSVLDAALQASWNLPHSCKGGNCGLCKGRLLRGEIHYPNGRPLGLSDAEIESGFILLCQATARSDLDLELRQVRPAGEHGASRIPCRIEQAKLVARDVIIVILQLPPVLEFRFRAGQHLDILLPQGRRRSFSIASAPHAARDLELHVRRVKGGEWTEWLFANSGVLGALLTIEAPLGGFYLREGPEHVGPMLLVGGGTGIAPLISILRHLADHDAQRELILYWGVRDALDLYVQTAVLELVSRMPRTRYVPVLSEPDSTWSGRSGLVHDAVLRDFDDLAAFDIYAAGPPAMIEALRSEFPARGAAIDRMYCDAFDYACDSFERQCTSALTKS